MPFKAAPDPRNARIPLRCTPAEKEHVQALAKEAGLTVSQFLLRRALGTPVHSKADVQTINELRRLGGLLKHLHTQSGGAYRQATAEAVNETIAAIRRIAQGEN